MSPKGTSGRKTMSMIHHGSEKYEVAVSAAGRNFQTKIEEMIHHSVPRVQAVIDQIQNDVPDDAVTPAKKMQFDVTPVSNQIVLARENDQPLTLHDRALMQIADRAKVKNLRSFVRDLTDSGNVDWRRKLVAHNLNELYHHMNGDRFLLRSVRGQLRGFLSDSYKRMDSRPLLDAFVGAIQRFGARPVDGFALDTKERVRAIMPMIFEPFPGEFLAFGAELANSNYGDGAFTFSQFVMRAYCTNYAISEDVLRKVHLGTKLPDDLSFSQKTIDLNTRAMASGIDDVSSHVLGAPAINNYLGMVRKANEEKIEAGAINTWVKKHLDKSEGDRVKNLFASADVENLPPGQTNWRFSNAISWLANETKDEHRKLDLQDLAGGLLVPKAG
jgi:hypothetical protein